MNNQQIINNNIEQVRQKIRSTCELCGRSAQNIELVAISKFHPVSAIKQAYDCGMRHFGENYIQEWREKNNACKNLTGITWHIAGHIQKNKIKYLNESAHHLCIQSLDSVGLLLALEKNLKLKRPVDVLIQLKIDLHSTEKSGCTEEIAREIIKKLANCMNVNFIGFMAIGVAEKTEIELKTLFSSFVHTAKKLWNTYSNNQKTKDPVISLGMSDDLICALECGSTMLRIGTAIFGKREI